MGCERLLKSAKKKSKKMNDTLKTLEFLHTSSHLLHIHSPNVSRHILSKLENKAISHSVELDSRIKKSFCHSCHTYYLPGVNCSARISSKRIHSDQNSKVIDLLTYDNGRQPLKLHNYIIYSCWICKKESILSGSTQLDIENMRKSVKESASQSNVKNNQTSNPTNSQKKKKKRHNQSQLLDLIQSKKPKTESKRLNLNDFLSSL